MTAVVDSRITDKMRRSLTLCGFSIIELPQFSPLGEATRSHPDTLLCKLGDSIVSSAEYLEAAPFVFTDIRDAAPNMKIVLTGDTLGKKYPEDCAYNALVIGERIFCRTESISESILELAAAQHKKVISVNQGYAACTTLALGENAALTADKGMSRAMRAEGVRVYEIEEGGIALPPHKHGFIGGACGVFRDKVYFFGDYTKHPSRAVLEYALAGEGFTPVTLSDEDLIDLGGILFLD